MQKWFISSLPTATRFKRTCKDKVIQATDIHYQDQVGREAKGKDYVPVRKRNVAKLARTIRENQDNTTRN
jgi:hypothetical protein